jgi:copper resistance protein C
MKTLHTMILATATVVTAFASPFAAAHASLKSSSPESGATLAVAPKEIALTFNERVAEAFSTISVTDGQGKNIAAEKARTDAINPAVLRLPVPMLVAGSYTVTWAVAGRDGHRRKGSFTFTVK